LIKELALLLRKTIILHEDENYAEYTQC